jgi:glycosyltransferase involved in cell wall biosynthesis
MQVVLVDATKLDYTPVTPFERPLGGMQSSACYLAAALAARGHSVTLMNRTTAPGVYAGVRCVGVDTASAANLNVFDVVVSISAVGTKLRQMGVTRPLVLWTGHDIDQAAVQSLRDGTERYLWDKIVLMSNWQANRYSTAFRIRPEQISILRYAISPAFEGLSRSQPYFFVSGRPPALCYSSTPFRGLDVLMSAFPLIRTQVPGCEARIYSSLSVYQRDPKEDPHRRLYDLCRGTEGVHYVGSIGQAALAQAMTELDVLAYPSTFPETSCIALMEAMASGCMILSAALGALPETAAGFGNFCERPPNATPERFAELYARFVAEAIHDAYKNPNRYSARIDEQRAFALKNYSWGERAAEWETMLRSLSHQRVRSAAPRGNEPCPCSSGRRFEQCCGATV